MNIIEVNKMILYNLKTQYPEKFKNFEINGHFLTLQENKVPINKFNLYDLLTEQPIFTNSLPNLSPKAIFQIIELHIQKLSDNECKQFYKINSSSSPTEEENKLLQNCYSTFTKYMKYNDFLTPKIAQQLQEFINYILLLELEDRQKTELENKAIQKYREMVNTQNGQSDQKENEEEYTLELTKNGFASNIEIIMVTIGLLISFICSILCIFHK